MTYKALDTVLNKGLAAAAVSLTFI
jgi:hypothetical protein